NAINASLYDKLPFDFVRDSAPVAGTMLLTNVMVVHPDVPAKTVAEFIAYAKANPGKINMASSGSGTSVHMSGELFKAMTGINMQHVPYRGSAPAMQDLLSNRVQVMFDNPTTAGRLLPNDLKPQTTQLWALSKSAADPSPWQRWWQHRTDFATGEPS